LGALESTVAGEELKKEDQDPIALRNLAQLTAQTLFHEHYEWGKLMKIQNLDIPA